MNAYDTTSSWCHIKTPPNVVKTFFDSYATLNNASLQHTVTGGVRQQEGTRFHMVGSGHEAEVGAALEHVQVDRGFAPQDGVQGATELCE